MSTTTKKSIPYFDGGKYMLTVEGLSGLPAIGKMLTFTAPKSTPEMVTGVDRNTPCAFMFANTVGQQEMMNKRISILEDKGIPYNVKDIELEI